jgi:hypothetical protein
VLAWSVLAGGGAAVATGPDLRLLSVHGDLTRRPWFEVDRAVWDAGSRTLAVWWSGRRRPMPLELTEVRRFPSVVQDRVRSSVVSSVPVELDGGRTVVVAVRRDPQGALRLQVSPGPGVRLEDETVSSQVRPVALALAEDVGMRIEGDPW